MPSTCIRPKFLVLAALGTLASAQAPADLTWASIEDLVNLKVSSVSRKEQPLSHTAAAVFVITAEDIRRSGAKSLPEALRMAPGLSVARIDSSKWAVSARGFNWRFADKMLVLFDDRSVYNGLFSGVYWDENDLSLDDVERIEVIRGPGGTLWGANAVNGVINVITKAAGETQGTQVTLSAGLDDLANGSIRYGGRAGENVAYRFYTKSFRRNALLTEEGGNAGDAWNATRAGGRLDWRVNERDTLTLHGDAFTTRSAQSIAADYPFLTSGQGFRDRIAGSGGYVMAAWKRRLSARSGLELQSYVSRENRSEYAGILGATTADVDFQHRFGMGRRHDVSWGGGYRQVSDSILESEFARFDPRRRNVGLAGAFLQDEMSLVEDRLTLTLGTKLQRNAFSGLEAQPNARLLWTPSQSHSLWSAYSRSVRTPSRRDHDLRIDFAIPNEFGANVVGRLTGNTGFQSEAANTVEAGYRRQWGNTALLDVAAFRSHYSKLQDFITGLPQVELQPALRVVVPLSYANLASAKTRGVETAGTWNAARQWKLSGHYSWLQVWTWGESGLLGQGFSPRASAAHHQARLASSMDLARRWSLDASAQYVSRLEGLKVPAYVRVDARLAWRWTPDAELSIGGTDLARARHAEMRAGDYILNALARRTVYVRLSFRY